MLKLLRIFMLGLRHWKAREFVVEWKKAIAERIAREGWK